MNVVLLLWRTRLRASWRAALVLVVLLGLAGAVSLSVAAGARRTASANEAILRSTNAADLNAAYGPADPREIEETVRALDGVADTNQWVGFQAAPPRGGANGFFTVIGFWQEPITVSRPVVTTGRWPTGPNEAMVNEAGSRSFGLQPGERIELSLSDSTASFDDPRQVMLDVVGIGLLTDEVIEDELGAKDAIFVPRAFTERHVDRGVWGKARVDLEPGIDPEPIVAALAQKGLFVDELLSEDRSRVQDALRPLLVTLAGLAALAATATVLVTAQSLTRLLRRRRNDDRSLRAIGCATRHLVGIDLLYAATVAFAGAALAMCLAVVASPLFPVGPARRSGLFSGIEVDLVALGGGGAALALAVVAVVGLGSWRRRSTPRLVSPGRVPPALAARPASATGFRLATAQRGVLTTLLGVAAGLAILVATVTFTGSLDRLIGDSSLVGLSWDIGGRAAFDAVDTARVRDLVGDDPEVQRATALSYYSGEANGRTVPLAVFDGIKGHPWPPLAAGRLPAAKGEALVGRATLEQLDLQIGDTITVAIPKDDDEQTTETLSRTFKIVGSAVAPSIGLGGTDTPKLGSGVLVSAEALDIPLSSVFFPIVLFDLAEGAEPSALRARFPEGLPVEGATPTEWFTSAAPAEVSQAESARTVIWLGVGALAVAIVGTVVHSLLGSVRQRRGAYAVMKAVGFTRAQVRTTVLCQSGALLVLAVLVALPVGIAAGRWLWTGFAQRLGIVPDPAVPLLLLTASVLATVALCQGAALLPAALARRTPLAQTLRSE